MLPGFVGCVINFKRCDGDFAINLSNESVSILMIDDNPADADLLRRRLRDDSVPWSVRLDATLSVDDALEALSENQYDVFFVDYQFPFGNGFTMLEKLRDEGYDAPAIMLTGKGNEEVAARAVKRNLHDYIPKDRMTTDTLREAVEGVLREARGPVGTASEKDTARTWVRLAPPNDLIELLSSRRADSGSLDLLVLGLVPSGDSSSADPIEIDHELLVRSVFQEVALDTLDFFSVRPDVLVGVLPDPLTEVVSLDSPLEALSERLGDSLADLVPASSEQLPVDPSVRLIEVSGKFVDPASLINQALDVARNSDETERITLQGFGNCGRD